MPTCASKIMLTSLAPSPTARVMGCSLEALISFTICRSKKKKKKKKHSVPPLVVIEGRAWCLFLQVSHLRFLQRRHATAEHGTTVATDLQKYVLVVAGPGSLLVGLQDCGQSGPVDDQTKIQAVDWQPGGECQQNKLISSVDISVIKPALCANVWDYMTRGFTANTVRAGVNTAGWETASSVWSFVAFSCSPKFILLRNFTWLHLFYVTVSLLQICILIIDQADNQSVPPWYTHALLHTQK